MFVGCTVNWAPEQLNVVKSHHLSVRRHVHVTRRLAAQRAHACNRRLTGCVVRMHVPDACFHQMYLTMYEDVEARLCDDDIMGSKWLRFACTTLQSWVIVILGALNIIPQLDWWITGGGRYFASRRCKNKINHLPRFQVLFWLSLVLVYLF